MVYFKVLHAVKSVVASDNVGAAIDPIAQTTLRRVVGQHTLDETLAETDWCTANRRQRCEGHFPPVLHSRNDSLGRVQVKPDDAPPAAR